ncbi:MAG: NADH:ubiquinone oxidoreductase [Deltaproteobacteria bacterium CG11_big_fil_rev_8_21_14_0_20_49_13]|nr:MAG: NADH:ubiquinone oxidoreductase [Deltaproteobacteria bacterium CG11_big_fil_rev_8_21_14_0_20_49_13]
MSKPRVAFFDFASCEGDQLQVVNLEESLLDLLGHVDVVEFREAMKERSDSYDIAFIEGSITRKADEERLKKIRANAKILIALGACATIGGINSLKNYRDQKTVRQEVYGDKWELFDTYPARPIDAVVKVDYKIHGCPINRTEFLNIVKSLLMGQKPCIPNYPICVECKQNGNVCVFEKGMSCVGPVTRAGCGACCVNEGAVCWGCRGLVDNPNTDVHKEVLAKYDLTTDEVLNKFKLYFGWTETKDKVA